ncbi:hypothetical protein F7725_003915 [Dissostichus mawsoni]|uniref:Thioredoxin domain-containing protein n=1 Tax=Dissostichus mawsoni TaxID=36200 RepID=A0A7J5YE63_DISMA|nr:hypothetical protein F7725_003915 [Dissostichus mawsoni]
MFTEATPTPELLEPIRRQHGGRGLEFQHGEMRGHIHASESEKDECLCSRGGSKQGKRKGDQVQKLRGSREVVICEYRLLCITEYRFLSTFDPLYSASCSEFKYFHKSPRSPLPPVSSSVSSSSSFSTSLQSSRVPVLSRSRSLPRSLALASLRRAVSFNVQDHDDFDVRVIKSELPVLVDFHAQWCGPCKILGPRLEKAVAKQNGKVTMAKVDIDDHTDWLSNTGVCRPDSNRHPGRDVIDHFVGIKDDDDSKMGVCFLFNPLVHAMLHFILNNREVSSKGAQSSIICFLFLHHHLSVEGET